MAVALLLDRTLSDALAPYAKTVKHHSHLARAIKEMGEYQVLMSVVVALCVFHARHWWAGVQVLLSAGAGGLMEVGLKWIIGRGRPMQGRNISVEPFTFEMFRGGFAGFLDQANLCFPSGHATLAFALATSLGYLLPRWKWLWFGLAVLVGAQRIAELAHYTSDVVGGAICGILSAMIARRIIQSLQKPQEKMQIEHALQP